MTTRKGILSAGLAALVLTGAAGCGGGEVAPRSQSSDDPTSRPSMAATAPLPGTEAPDVDAAVVRGTREYDYEPAPSLKALASEQPSVAVGEVVGWSDGRSVVESDGSGYVDTSFFAVLEVKVAQSYRAVDGQDADGRIYVEIPRGGEVRIDGEAPEGTEPVYSTIDELNKAVPTGTRVIVVGGEAPTASELESQTSDATVQDATAGQPDGVKLLWPNVQGLIFEDESGAFTSGMASHEDEWNWLPPDVPVREGFDQLLAELDTLDK